MEASNYIGQQMTDNYNTEFAAAELHIYNACSPSIQERYLKEILSSDPNAMWKALKDVLQGTDENTRSF